MMEIIATYSNNTISVLAVLVDNYGYYSDLVRIMSMIVPVMLKLLSIIGRGTLLAGSGAHRGQSCF